MQTNELVIMALMSATIIGGILFGSLGMVNGFMGLFVLAVVSIVVFTTTMFLAVVASAPERETMRLPVFRSAILSACVAGCCLLAGLIGMFRPSVRKCALVVVGFSMLISPIFFLVVSNQ